MPSAVALMHAIQEGLLSGRPPDRMQALLALLALPDAAQARAMLADHAEADPDPGVRALATGALMLLSERPDPTAASSIAPPKKLAAAFREKVRDPRPRVRLGALAQVLKYRGGVLVELVEEAMSAEEDPEVLGAMVAVLSRTGSPAHLGAVARLVEHPDPRVAERALAAAVELGHEAVLPLVALHREAADPRVRAAAVAACEPLDPERLAFRPAPPGSADALAAQLISADPKVRFAALSSASTRLDDPAIEGLVEVLSELDAEPAVAAAARALLGRQSELADAAAPTPVSAADLPDLERSWARLPPRQLAEKRLRARLGHPEPRVRREALAQLADHPVKALLPVVVERLGAEDDLDALAGLVRAIGRLGSDAEVPRLVGYLSHGNPRVVRASVIALHRLAGDDMLPHVLTLLARPDPRVQEQAIAALLRLGPDKLLAYVITMGRSAREDARHRALALLERLESPAIEDVALDMLEREQSERLIPRELALLGRTATLRSIGLLWTVRRRRPTLADPFTLLVNRLSDRWGISAEEIRARGEVFLDEHPELLEPPAAAAPARERPRARWRIFSLPDELDRGWLRAAAFAAVLAGCYTFDVGGFRSAGQPGGLSPDAERQLVENTAREAARPPPPAPELPPAQYAAALSAVAASYLPAFGDPPKDRVMAAERARLKALGITHEPYLDLEARGAVRAPSNRSLRESAARVARGDPEGAVAILREALAATEAENLLVRRDLTREIARLLVRIGRLDEARATAVAGLELARKVVAIRRAATRPDGSAIGTFDEERAVERSAADLAAAFDEAARRLRDTGAVDGLAPAEQAAAREQVDELARTHVITAAEYAAAKRALENTR